MDEIRKPIANLNGLPVYINDKLTGEMFKGIILHDIFCQCRECKHAMMIQAARSADPLIVCDNDNAN